MIFSRLSGDRPKKSHFIVKVILESSKDKEAIQGLKVYNEDYLLYGDILQKYSPKEVKQVKEKIKKDKTDLKRSKFSSMRLFQRME